MALADSASVQARGQRVPQQVNPCRSQSTALQRASHGTPHMVDLQRLPQGRSMADENRI